MHAPTFQTNAMRMDYYPAPRAAKRLSEGIIHNVKTMQRRRTLD